MGCIFIVGDFNIDFYKKNGYKERLEKDLLCLGLKQYITEPTRITTKSKTIIDLVFSNFYIKNEVLLTPKITDHQIIRLDLTVTDNEDRRGMQIVTRDYSRYNDEEFREMLKEEVQKVKYFEEEHTNEMAVKFVNTIAKAIEKIAPLTKKLLRISG